MILKLSAGQRVLMTVASVEETKGNFGQQIKFAGATSDDADAAIFMSVDTAHRQLGMCGFSLTSVVGQPIEFEKVAKDGKTFININKPGAAKAATAPASNEKQAFSSGGPLPFENTETGAPPAVESGSVFQKLDKMFQVYDVCFDHAFDLAQKKMGADASHEGIAAMGATLFIQAAQRGVLA